MWTRVNGMTVSKFRKSEDGAILVFFAICCAAIFLVASLSFDIGRRASTQTELQSFADNVALAAAGELNGFDGAVWRAKNAAENLIQDKFTIGAGDTTLSGPSDFTLKFYETLPDDESAWDTPLDVSAVFQNGAKVDPVNDRIARFVRVELVDTEVPWVFANVLKIFSQDDFQRVENLRFVTAEATGGYTSLACDVAPIFFCMPTNKDNPNAPSKWNPEDHIGDQILIRTGQQQDSFWESGNFGWLDVRETFPEESKVNPNGDCFGETGVQLLVCLIAAENAVTTCFENGLLTTLPGQKQGIESAVFNTRFDMYNAVVSKYANQKNFEPAPLVGRGFVDSKGDACYKNSVTDVETMPFPLDDCFDDTSCSIAGSNTNWNTVERFGDGDWSANRREYVEANYSVDGDSVGAIATADVFLQPGDPGWLDPDDPDSGFADRADGNLLIKNEEVTIQVLDVDGNPGFSTFHVDDPFRPGRPLDPNDPNDLELFTTNGSYFQELGNPDSERPISAATRFDYYVAEVLLTYWNSGIGASTPGNNDMGYTKLSDAFNDYKLNPDTFFKDAIVTLPAEDLLPDLPRLLDSPLTRQESFLPQCAPDASQPLNAGFSPDPRRRVVVAAAVDCTQQEVNGKTDDVQAQYFIEVFLTQPVKGDPNEKEKFDMYVEIIGPPLNVGSEKVAKGTFRNLVQLYR